MNLGVVGTGKMGSTLIDGIFRKHPFDISVFAYNRTKEKISALSGKYPQLIVFDKIEAVVEMSTVLVLAVPFSFIQGLSYSVIANLRNKQPLTLVLCGYAPMGLLEKCLPSKVAKAYPNINWAVGAGVTIVNFGRRFDIKDKETIFSLLARVGTSYEVSEDQFRPLSNLMSCGPALWIKLIDLFIKANTRKYKIDPILSFEVSRKTIEGTFQLMEKRGYNIEQVIKKVASPGGTTEVGLKCFDLSLPRIFADTVEQISLRDRERTEGLEIK